MLTRLIAALIGLAVLIPVLLWAGPLGVELVVSVVLLISLDEYARMAFPTRRQESFVVLVVLGALLYGAALYGTMASVVGALVCTGLGSFIWALFRPDQSLEGAADRVGRMLLGVFWVVGLGLFVPLIRREGGGTLELTWIFTLFVIPWMGDTGGYFAGKYLGKAKLYPLVSPKKTWAGFFGGLLGSVVGLFIVRSLFGGLTAFDCVLLGLSLGAFGVVGDLSESLLKRAFGVKDSGNIMPGHGGLLDRIDSLLFVAPLLFAYVSLVKGS